MKASNNPTKTTPIYSSLAGHLLVAAPHMDDERFSRSVIFMCQHDADGAMGLIINQPMISLNFSDLTKSLEMGSPRDNPDRPVYTGGPVEPKRGFILHSHDQMMPDTIAISDDIALSVQKDKLLDIAQGLGPKHIKIMLGCTGWSAGQLEDEMREGIWFHMPASDTLLFDEAVDHLWDTTFKRAGLNAGALSSQSGTA